MTFLARQLALTVDSLIMEFSKIILYVTGTPCARRASRYQRLTDYVLKKYRNNLGVFSIRRTETNMSYVEKLASRGISPRLLAVEYETTDGESDVMLYSSFIRLLVERGEL